MGLNLGKSSKMGNIRHDGAAKGFLLWRKLNIGFAVGKRKNFVSGSPYKGCCPI